jgi:hypothetical protein
MWYLNSAFNAYQKVQESLQSGLSQVGSAALSPLQMMKGSLQGGGADNALRKRIAELEARLNKPSPQRRRRRTTR